MSNNLTTKYLLAFREVRVKLRDCFLQTIRITAGAGEIDDVTPQEAMDMHEKDRYLGRKRMLFCSCIIMSKCFLHSS